MRTTNIHEAKTQLSKLVEQAANGEPFVIAKAGKPMVKVTALDIPEPRKIQRFGFMRDVGTTVPEDFDRMFDAEIEQLFGLNDIAGSDAAK
jgi:prevent-host-death family protein